jgi:hypothetical protein
MSSTSLTTRVKITYSPGRATKASGFGGAGTAELAMAVPSATTLMASARSRPAQDDASRSWTADSRGMNGRSTSRFAEPRSVKSADAERSALTSPSLVARLPC